MASFLSILCASLFLSHLESFAISANASDCSCGHTKSRGVALRVVGGRYLGEDEHPFVAILLYNQVFECGASIIGRNYLLTAAHCIPDRYRLRNFVVILGAHDRVSKFNDNVVSRSVRKIIRHSNFRVLKDDILINDIALLLVDRIEFNDKIQPICLPNIDLSRFRAAMIQGWGSTYYGGPSTRFPKEAIVGVKTVSQCQESRIYNILARVPNIDHMVLCAYENSVDACQGDSGGPLFLKTENETVYQIGIVSFGAACGNREGIPGLYTRLSSYMDWLEEHMTSFCTPAV